MNRALFPLPIFLLPNGITRLRVFEARYIRLVQESAGDTGFVITPIGNLKSIDALPTHEADPAIDVHSQWGSFVKIIDFEKGDDGLLEIDVQCESLALVTTCKKEQDGLRKGDIRLFEFWPPDLLENTYLASDDIRLLESNLKHIFNLNPELEDLYAETHFDDPIWVCQRWLELLPLKQQEMNVFAQPASLERAVQFLSSVVFK